MTDALALQGIALAARSLERAYRDGHDLEAREAMALAALFSGITLTNAGLGAVHGFAAPLGANFPAPHGAVCAALLPHIIAANVKAMRDSMRDDASGGAGLARYATVGRQLTGRADLADPAAIDACIEFTSDLARRLSIPALSAFGMSAGDVPEMAKLARKASSMRYNPVALSDDALAGALTAAIEGRAATPG